MALVARRLLLQGSVARIQGTGGYLFNLMGGMTTDQQRNASSHAENTNFFIKEVRFGDR